MKNSDIMSCYEGLTNLRKVANRRLPARTSFAIIRNLKTLQPIVEDIQTAYNELVLKYAEPVEEGQYKVKPGCLEDFNREATNLYNVDTEVSIVKIKFSEIENLDFTLNETEALYFIIEEGEA